MTKTIQDTSSHLLCTDYEDATPADADAIAQALLLSPDDSIIDRIMNRVGDNPCCHAS